MKRSFRGRNSGSTKSKKKEIRNARGLGDVLGDSSHSGTRSASDLEDFLQERRRKSAAAPKTLEKDAKKGEAKKGGGYLWTADGPQRAGPGERASESDRVEAGADDPGEVEDGRPPAVHARKPEVQNLFRANERFRAPGKAGDERRRSTRREADRDELAEKLRNDEREDRAGGRGKSAKSKKTAHPPGRPNPPVYFDDRESRQAKGRGPAKAADRRFVEGVVKRHPDGFGFVIPDDHELPDVYVPRNYMTGVMTNDRVKVEVYSSRHADRVFGEIKEVLTRAYTRVVGAYLPVDRSYGLILGEGKGWGTDLKIPVEFSQGAGEGDLVAVEIVSYPGPQSEFTGRVVEIIGDIGEPLNDVKRIVFAHHIPHEFSQEALGEARKYGKHVAERDAKGRVDLRAKPLITIDGATARDFDDAICVERGDDGFKLWVAIADVSHYVKPGTALDDEAFERGTSTYFPNYVVPMLPEELSNELCSLNPGVDRLCFVCEMDIDFQGHVSSHKFYEAVMRSRARVTYGEAQEAIDGRVPPKIVHVAENIRVAADLAKVLMATRFREGSLDLEIPETQVVVDPSGETSDIIKSERLFAHRLIEELMLVANVSTARFFAEADVPGIYRVHEEPFEESIKALQRFLFNFGGNRSMSGGKLQKKITRALQAFENKPEAQILNILTLRSMQQAKYSPVNVGHFGLGFSHYSHFTSPIRRYPDLIAHRLIKSVLYPGYRGLRMTQEDLATAATMLSACEQRSVKAERQLISIKKARFISRFTGDEFEGMISSVAKFGVFVLLRAYDVDGLVKVEELGNDRFVFDEENLRLVGKRTGTTYAIGDQVRVEVVRADSETGKVEFRLAGVKGAPTTGSKKDRKNVQKRGKTENDRRRVREERVSKRRRKA